MSYTCLARPWITQIQIMQINVSSNYRRLSRSLDTLGRKQLPFAFAKTLNQTMKAVGKYTVARTYPRAFDVRNRAFFKASMFTGTAIRRAKKTKLRVSARDRFDRGNLSATRDRWNQARGQGALLSRHVLPRRRGEPGVYAKRYVPAPLLIVQRATSIGMAHVMRSTSGLGAVVARSGCSTFCNPEHGYGNASGSMRTRNGSRGQYRPSCFARTSVKH